MTTPTMNPPEWAKDMAHRLANERGDDHCLLFRISDCGFGTDSVGATWVASHICETSEADWASSPYVAIAGEYDPDEEAP